METKPSQAFELLGRYLSARIDLIGLFGRNLFFGVAVGALIVVLIGGIGLTAVVFLFYGAAEGVGHYVGDRWLGYLAMGGILTLFVVSAILLTMRGRKTAADRLKAEAKRTSDDLARMLRTIDPAAWTREHPWQSTGTAAVAGFVVAGGLKSPSPPSSPPPSSLREEKAEKKEKETEPSILLSALATATVHVVQNALTPILSEALRESKLGEILGVDSQRRRQDGHHDGSDQKADGAENRQSPEDAQKEDEGVHVASDQ